MFNKIYKGSSYSRPQLAELWGYASFHAIARGVITPKIRTRSFYSLQKRNNHFKHSIKIAYVKAYSFGKDQQTILLNNG